MSVLSLLLCVTLAAVPSHGLVPIPGGFQLHPSCIQTVPNGMLFNPTDLVVPADCQLEAPLVQIYAADVHQQVSGKPGFSSLTADWIVPPLPTEHADQVVYFWPGFKSKQPEMGYPVLQPVLQYGQDGLSTEESSRRLLGGGGGGNAGGHWQLQSWFVDANSRFKYPVVTAPAISVSPGDKITSFMRLDGDTWTVSGVDSTTGQNSTLVISKKHAGNCDYDYAMLVNENINVNSVCTRMPAAEQLVFTNILLDGVPANWTTRANCNGNPQCDCGNNASVASGSGDVALGWRSK
eukprot:TRINITY_DN15317_c0_g1_i2.p1 TRINITY_DN15317_c0_g1~~TRINITY_DN15317_c0_g1_i2.p1  ORF type:complete len:293 (-),score=63.90 TRINITY_DN15317_c0_g1_i2:176-1054(-)